jgi:hypothetical protein
VSSAELAVRRLLGMGFLVNLAHRRLCTRWPISPSRAQQDPCRVARPLRSRRESATRVPLPTAHRHATYKRTCETPALAVAARRLRHPTQGEDSDTTQVSTTARDVIPRNLYALAPFLQVAPVDARPPAIGAAQKAAIVEANDGYPACHVDGEQDQLAGAVPPKCGMLARAPRTGARTRRPTMRSTLARSQATAALTAQWRP